MITTPVKTAITDTYTEIVMGNDTAYGFAVYAVDSSNSLVPWFIKTTVSGVDIPLPASSISFDHIAESGEFLFYAKTVSGSASLVLVAGSYNKS